MFRPMGWEHNDKICANINTCDGRQITWSKELRYLGIFIVSSQIFRCSLDCAKRSFHRAADAIFGNIGRIASEDVLLQLLKLECIPVLLYALEVCQLLRRDLQSLDFIVSIFMKLIRTNDMSIIRYCQEMFYFELPSITLQKRSEKFEMNIAMLILFY